MKNAGSRKYLLLSAVLVLFSIMVISISYHPVLAGDNDGGVHGARDEGFIDIECSQIRYKTGEVIYFKVTNRFNETITDPLPYICNDDGDVVEGWLRADVLPYPTLSPGQYSDYSWNPYKYSFNDIKPGRYYVAVLHASIEYIQEFWIYDPAETYDISDGFEGDAPFLMGPGS